MQQDPERPLLGYANVSNLFLLPGQCLDPSYDQYLKSLQSKISTPDAYSRQWKYQTCKKVSYHDFSNKFAHIINCFSN